MKKFIYIFLICILLLPAFVQAANTKNKPPIELFKKGSYKCKYSYLRETKISYPENEIEIAGEYWKLTNKFKNKSDIESERQNLEEKLKNNNFKILFTDKSRCVASQEARQKDTTLYAEINYRASSAIVHLYLHRELKANTSQEIEFKKGIFPKKSVLSVNTDGKFFYKLKLEILEGKGAAFFYEFKGNKKNANRILSKFGKDCDKKYYKTYQFYNLLPYGGLHRLYFTRLNYARKADAKIKVTLIKTTKKLPHLPVLSAKPSLLTVKNSTSNLPKVSPIGQISGDFSNQGDYLPSGSAIYWLNGGYYNLVNDNLQTNLIPLIPNHATELNWPLEYAKIAQEKQATSSAKLAVYGIEKLDGEKLKIDFSLSHLPKNLKITKEDFSVAEEGNVKAEILSLTEYAKPMNVVVLVDSSYSMVKNMKIALQAVEKFVAKLPEDAKVTVVDFDTKVKPIKANNRQDLIKKLRKVKANGSTALYDSVIKGLDILKGKSRANIILFTDGKDANYNDTKRGSVATFKQMMAKVQKQMIPVYPVAFGNDADTTTLNAIAKTTKTTYYKGNDSGSLEEIFESIRKNLTSAYTIIAKRSKKEVIESSPTVNYMVDISGSMNKQTTLMRNSNDPELGNRFEPLKDMLETSFNLLPNNFFIQLSSFAAEVKVQQILTKNRARLLTAIGNMVTGGGTNIKDALSQGLDLCNVATSNKSYFIFITDAAGEAFKFNEDEQKEIKSILSGFKQNKIKSLWIGMFDDPKSKKIIKSFAAESNGECLITPDMSTIKTKLIDFTQKIPADAKTFEQSGRVSLRLVIRNPEDGKISFASTNKIVDFPVLTVKSDKKPIEEVNYSIKPINIDKASYNYQNSKNIYGNDAPIKEVRLDKILPLTDSKNKPVSGRNKAVSIEVSNAYLFSRLKSISAGHSKKYIVIDLKLSNLLPAQSVVVLKDGSNHPSGWLNKSNDQYETKKATPTYKIPNLSSHLFLRVNNANELPFNKMTWLLENPLTQVDEYELFVSSGIDKKGVLCFYIPDEPLKALSLHLYDTSYGHIDIPIIGELDKSKTKSEIAKLPTSSPTKLGEAFGIRIKNIQYKTDISGIKINENSVFEVLECSLQSKVNALLKLEPQKRFRLAINTPNGDWYIKPHPITKEIPLGFFENVSVSPGSHNNFAIAFQIPKNLKDCKQSLLIELKGEDVLIDIPQKTTTKSEQLKPITTVSGDKIKLNINKLYKLSRLADYRCDMLLADITLEDEIDTQSTRIRNILAISNTDKPNLKGRKTASTKNMATKKGLGNFSSASSGLSRNNKFSTVDSETFNRILGYEPITYDGAKSRSLVLFDIKKQKKKGKLYLTSPVFDDLKHEIVLKKLPEFAKDKNWMLTKKLKINTESIDSYIDKKLKVVRQLKTKRLRASKKLPKPKVTLDSPKELPQYIETVPATIFGAEKLSRLNSLEQALETLKAIEWIPAIAKTSFYSSDSILTQNWGTEYDMLSLVLKFLKSTNAEIETGVVGLTVAGKEKLKQKAPNGKIYRSEIPFVKWKAEGKESSLVIPFFEKLDALKEFIDTNAISHLGDFTKSRFSVSIELFWRKRKDSTAMQMGAMASALGGETSNKLQKTKLFSSSFYYHPGGEMPIDVWFGEGKTKNGKSAINIFYTSPTGIEVKTQKLKQSCKPVKLEIEIDGSEKRIVYFKENQKLSDFFFTISKGAPDLPQEPFEKIVATNKKLLSNIKNLDPLSLAQYLNRNKIYRFIAAQTKNTKDLSDNLKVSAKHNENLRTIIATLQKTSDCKLISSLDLRSINCDVIGEEKNVKSFNFISGLMATEAEGMAANLNSEFSQIPMTVTKLWNKTKDLGLNLFLPKNKKENLAVIADLKAPQWIMERLKKTRKAWLFPDKPFNGRYGWFEINIDNYQTISVLDNGEFGSMTDFIVTNENVEAACKYFLGLLIGANISVGSAVAMAIDIADYKQLKAAAHKMAKEIGKALKSMEANIAKVNSAAEVYKKGMDSSVSGKEAGDEAKNFLKGEGKGQVEDAYKIKLPEKCSDIINFGQGIDNAISAYFSSMP
jgi:Mg-chelatase subunit ChlD